MREKVHSISIQFKFDKINFSDIWYFEGGEKERKYKVPLGKGKDVYLIIKKVTSTTK